MKTNLYTTRNKCTIDYDPAIPCLIDTVGEFLYHDEFRQHMNKGLELLTEKKKLHGEIGWLANTRFLVAMPDENVNWIAEDWVPRAAAAGIRYIALVLPDDEIVRMASHVFDDDYKAPENGVIQKVFSDLTSAGECVHQSLKK